MSHAPPTAPPLAPTHPLLHRLLHWQRRLRALDRRRPWLLDAAVPLLVLLQGLPELLGHPDTGGFATHNATPPLPALLALDLALVLPLWWRRRAPVTAFAVIAAVVVLEWSFGVWQRVDVALLIALFNLALHGPLGRLPWAAATTAGAFTLAAFRFTDDQSPWLNLFFLLGTATAAMALGLTFRSRRAQLTALEERAARLEVERDQRTRLAAAAERTRVAREMHDIVGHNLAVMVGLADGAATLATTDPARSAEAMTMVAGTGRQALGELRRVLGVLRDEPEAQLTPQPGVGDLDVLLERVRAAGAEVTYRTCGEPDSLERGLQLAVYRIVQEALTNTLKYAGPTATAYVSLDLEGGLVLVRVEDTGPPPGRPAQPRSPGGTGAGKGLLGMRERAAMYGGSVTAGPRPGGGWTVEVLLDPAAPATPAVGEPSATPPGGRL
ncbi:sensor histidine kinase [Streptacidiphilus jiangxiensis]|nr:histidine kinase [Streptacidiphilus jiangxiensis]